MHCCSLGALLLVLSCSSLCALPFALCPAVATLFLSLSCCSFAWPMLVRAPSVIWCSLSALLFHVPGALGALVRSLPCCSCPGALSRPWCAQCAECSHTVLLLAQVVGTLIPPCALSAHTLSCCSLGALMLLNALMIARYPGARSQTLVLAYALLSRTLVTHQCIAARSGP